ncbi:hypothetical protein U0070_007582 [Myodes glareolus]|uniref:Uncharacterized protein n=1 Tax=Myodes glareolus TaxID=447135 RepID=A0AAW0H4Q9_MYOGA
MNFSTQSQFIFKRLLRRCFPLPLLQCDSLGADGETESTQLHSVFPHPVTSKHSSSLTLEGKGGPEKIETVHSARWRKGFMDGVHLPPSDHSE